MSKLILFAALVALASACGDAERLGRRSAPAAVPLEALPVRALRACRASALLRPACPGRVPVAPYDPTSEIYDARVFAVERGGPETFNFQWGGETPGRPERNRPPRMVHLVLVGGELENEFSLHRREEPREGLMRTKRRAGLDLGPVRWNGRPGRLILAPPFPRGGINGNHLLFRWSEGDLQYQLGLHAWEPFTEAAATLRAIVGSLPPP